MQQILDRLKYKQYIPNTYCILVFQHVPCPYGLAAEDSVERFRS